MKKTVFNTDAVFQGYEQDQINQQTYLQKSQSQGQTQVQNTPGGENFAKKSDVTQQVPYNQNPNSQLPAENISESSPNRPDPREIHGNKSDQRKVPG